VIDKLCRIPSKHALSCKNREKVQMVAGIPGAQAGCIGVHLYCDLAVVLMPVEFLVSILLDLLDLGQGLHHLGQSSCSKTEHGGLRKRHRQRNEKITIWCIFMDVEHDAWAKISHLFLLSRLTCARSFALSAVGTRRAAILFQILL
jgi:hypothetical protein